MLSQADPVRGLRLWEAVDVDDLLGELAPGENLGWERIETCFLLRNKLVAL